MRLPGYSFLLFMLLCCAFNTVNGQEKKKELAFEKRYLNLPVQNDTPKQLELYHLWGDVHLSKLKIYELKSIWD